MNIVPVEIRQKFRWYREDTVSLLQSLRFMKLSAEERGVLSSLRLLAWTMGAVPTSADDLHVLTRLDAEVLKRVMPRLVADEFFALAEDGTYLFIPAFEVAMEQNHQALLAQREGGRRGGRRPRAPRARRSSNEEINADTCNDDTIAGISSEGQQRASFEG